MIPKIIHQMAPKDKNDWHPVWEECHLSWKKNFSELEYVHFLWNDEEIDSFVQKIFPKYWNFFNEFPFHIMKLDFARYCILYHYGGIYSDMDVYCYKNFSGDIKNKTCYLLESDGKREKVQNSLMISTKRNSFIKFCLEECVKNYSVFDKEINYDNFGDHCDYVLNTTGPKFLSLSYEKSNKKMVGILPKEEYNPELLQYSDEIKTRHMLTGRWGKETISYLKEKNIKENPEMNPQDYLVKDYFDFRKIDLKKYKFNKKNIEIFYE
jgi:hypothetical protein